jgi:glycosyltransferase involved in cell wall biosynthesis
MALPAKILRVKLVYHLHDALLSSKDGGTIEPLAQRILLFLMRHSADAIVVVSDFVGKTITCKDKSLSDKIRLLHNGLDIQRIRQGHIKRYQGGEPLIVSYGTLSARKGFHIGIEAISILKRDFGVNVHYQIIGDGYFRDSLLRLIREKQISDRVELLGFQDDVHKYVAEADIVLIPSVWEDPLPLVVIESMANSKIIIASETGGIPEMITDGKEGFLVPKNDAKQIAERIIDIVKHPEEANSIADHAYKRVQQDFTIERMASELESIYRSVLNRPIEDAMQ